MQLFFHVFFIFIAPFEKMTKKHGFLDEKRKEVCISIQGFIPSMKEKTIFPFNVRGSAQVPHR